MSRSLPFRSLRLIGAVVLALGVSAAPAQAQKPPAKKPAATAPKAGAKKSAAAPKASAKKPAAPADAPIAVELPIQRAKLDNGLRVVMSVDRGAPTVSVALAYDVGARDEPQGRSGVARLVEGLMFEGSKNVSAGDHRRLIEARGGTLEAETTPDSTRFAATLPAGDLALALWLEADRMRSLTLADDAFVRRRRLALEELRGQVASAPRAAARNKLEELVYQGYWPYAHPVLGAPADLEKAEAAWARDLFALYGPDRAVLTLVGDFEPKAAMELVLRHFGGIAARGAGPSKDAPLPEQTSQRTAVVQHKAALSPELLYGWPVPPIRHADHHALAVTAAVLGGGEGSRLYQLLALEKGVARDVRAAVDARRGPGVLAIDARLLEDAKLPAVRKLIEDEIQALTKRGPTDAELARARQLVQATWVAGLRGSGARALRLAELELALGDAGQLPDELARFAAVTSEDVQRVARDHLTPTRRSVVEVHR